MDPIFDIELQDCPICRGVGAMQDEQGWSVSVALHGLRGRDGARRVPHARGTSGVRAPRGAAVEHGQGRAYRRQRLNGCT